MPGLFDLGIEDRALNKRRDRIAQSLGLLANPTAYQQDPSETFPGEQPIQGLMDNGLLNPQQVQPLAGLLADSTTKDVGQNLLRRDVGLPISGLNTPSAVREWSYYNSLPPDDQKRFLDLKRQNYDIATIAGGQNVVRKGDAPSTSTLSTLNDEAKAKEILAASQSSGTIKGTDKTNATIAWPTVRSAYDELMSLTDRVADHPGIDYAVGSMSMAPTVPGTPQADFMALYKQIGGKQFMEAYKTLKGGGQITEIEGRKATEAMARMARAQSKEAFIAGVKEFQSIITKAVQQAAKKAGVELQIPEIKQEKQGTPTVEQLLEMYK